jgi:hypothetical protein
MSLKRILAVLLFCFLLLDLAGCESFTRKFTRKSKKSDQAVEMVLVPEEYKGPEMTKEELYRQYYLYWNLWQDELINSLIQNASLKKKIDCAQEALKNFTNMKMLLVIDAQKNFDAYLVKLNDLLERMKVDVYGTDNNRNLRVAEGIKAGIHQNFTYSKIRNYLK